jgi:N-acetylglucosaminyldiphosphoundecaprenol N-acetyl-beta-D-mannosaminyltransferase
MTPRVNILGVHVSAITPADALRCMEEWIRRGEREYACVCAVQTVMACRRDPVLRRIVNAAGLATPDGMPLVWILRSRGFPVARVYGPDLLLAFCALAAERGYSNYFLGGEPGVPEQLAERLTARFPGLKVVGTCSPPFRPLGREEDRHLVDRINAAAPDVVWVGLGTPKQDLWVREHRGGIRAPVMVGVGAAFDFHAGRRSQAPPWMRASGLEWVYRLCQEPRRLWRRYLLGHPLFVFYLLLQWSGLRRFDD